MAKVGAPIVPHQMSDVINLSNILSMYNFLFVAVLVVVLALAVFLYTDAKTHAQPLRPFLMAMFLVLAAAIIQYFAGWYTETALGSDTMPIWLAGPVNLSLIVSGAFGGAMASLAITNRAKQSHDTAAASALIHFKKYHAEVKSLLQAEAELHKQTPTDPGDVALLKQKKESISRLIARREAAQENIEEELSALGIQLDTSDR